MKDFPWKVAAFMVLLGGLLVVVYSLKPSVHLVHEPPMKLQLVPLQNANQSQVECPEKSSNITKLLLVTYYRGGSTFLGQLFNQNPEAFYWFEALHELDKYLQPRVPKSDHIDIGDFRRVLSGDDYETIALDVLRNIFDCQLSALFAGILKDPFVSPLKTNSAAPLNRCKLFQGKNPKSSKVCLKRFQDTCRETTLRVTKVIRLRLASVWRLLEIDPTIKVLYYTRDPRPIVLSRHAIPANSNTNIGQKAYYLCKDMQNDLAQFELLQKKYPQNVFRLDYEALALNPRNTSKQLYRDLHRPYPTSLDLWIKANTQAVRRDSLYGTRRNSSQILTQWRTNITQEQKLQIDTQCQSVLKLLGLDDDSSQLSTPSNHKQSGIS